MIRLFFWYVSLQLIDALVVTNEEGVVFYLSLGKWSTLVDVVKKDFVRVRKRYYLLPGKEHCKSGHVKQVLDQILNLLNHPECFGAIAPLIKLSFIFGTKLHQQIWYHLQKCLPAGETSTYNQIALALERPGQARVVGGACSANRIALLVPCHRVLSSKRELVGYRWGTGLKKELLEREGAQIS